MVLVFMYERVILPTDGSEIAEKGILKGLELAKALDIPVYSIYVMNVEKYEQMREKGVRQSVKKNMKKTGEQALTWVRKKAHEMGVDITTQLLVGEPYDRIVKEAHKEDVIYMSSHGASGIKEVLLGSTTQRVLKNAGCTVIVEKGE